MKERIEHRWFFSSDYLKTVFDQKGHIKEVEVIRKIERKKHQKFTLDIIQEYKKEKAKD